MQMGIRTTSMKHVGMTRDAMKEAVKGRLHIGQQYQIQSGRDDAEDKRRTNRTRCKLLYFSRNAAVFEDGDGTTETFTYQELWTMLMKERYCKNLVETPSYRENLGSRKKPVHANNLFTEKPKLLPAP